jgi:hypothetical protein
MQNNTYRFANLPEFGREITHLAGLLSAGGIMLLFSLLLAYAVGQLFSMLLRSEILAAFATCVALAFVAAWGLLMFGWQLSGLWFVFPIAAGLLLATWLRAPAWITERNTWRHWLTPAAAITLPAAAILASVPTARLNQISPIALQEAEQTLAPVESAYRAGDTPAARETATMYLNAVATYETPIELFGEPYNLRDTKASESTKEKDLVASVRTGHHRAVLELARLRRENFDAAVKEFYAATRRPDCRFDFPDFPLGNATLRFLTQYGIRQYVIERYLASRAPQYESIRYELNRPEIAAEYFRLMRFMIEVLNREDADDPVDHYLALLRASAHIRSSQSTSIFFDQLLVECFILRSFTGWARNTDPTTDQLHEAIDRLRNHIAEFPQPDESLFAVRNEVRRVLLDKQLPMALETQADSSKVYLAMLFNDLPWERERALREVDIATSSHIETSQRVVFGLAGPGQIAYGEPVFRREVVSRGVHARIDGQLGAGLPRLQPLPSLAAFELQSRENFDELMLGLVTLAVHRRATLTQFALTLYQRENGRYPDSLKELVPKYLDTMPLDPYSGEPFQYRPQGFDLPLIGAFGSESPRNRLPARTPLFWSVGPANATHPVKLSLYTPSVDITTEPNAPESREIVYALHRENDSYWYRGFGVEVFPLPRTTRQPQP